MPLFSQDKKVAALKSAPLFADLSRRELSELAKVTEDVDFDTGKVLCREGQTGHEFFGEIALVENLPRTATVTAQTPIRSFVLTRRSFLRLLDEQPRVERKVMRALARRLVSVSDDLSL